jgi:hypothetical protein
VWHGAAAASADVFLGGAWIVASSWIVASMWQFTRTAWVAVMLIVREEKAGV